MKNVSAIIERHKKILYPLCLVLLTILALTFIELKYPFFFLQDDSRDYNFPSFLHNYRSMLHGELAIYNFHQYLGMPSLSCGQPAPFYPLTYIVFFLSQIFFHHYYAAMDLYVSFHLIFGALGFYMLMVFWGLDRKSAFFGGLTWTLNTFAIYVSDSWPAVSAVTAYMPWLVLLSCKLYSRFSVKTFMLLIISRLMLFLVGHPQFFIYTVLFELVIYILFVWNNAKQSHASIKTHSRKKQKNKSQPALELKDLLLKISPYGVSYVVSLLLSLPFLLPILHQLSISSDRNTAYSKSLYEQYGY